MAEIKISTLVRQCLGKRRLSDIETYRREIWVWQEERNRLGASVEWRFTTLDARIKLRGLYPAEEQRRRARGEHGLQRRIAGLPSG